MDININNHYKNAFIMCAISRGWMVKKNTETEYIFSKKHLNNPKYFKHNYLGKFIRKCSGNRNKQSLREL